MNKTRKRIIEIIEPYMDKTLSKWCMIYVNHLWVCWDEHYYTSVLWDKFYWITEIIWNPLEERYLDLYCINNWINIIKNSYWEYQSRDKVPLFNIDISKSLENQTEETLGKIFNYFIRLWKHQL